MSGKYWTQVYTTHFAKILSNISIVSGVLVLFTFLSFILSAIFIGIVYIFVIVAILVTFGTILLVFPSLKNLFKDDGSAALLSSFEGLLQVMISASPILTAISGVAAITSIVLLATDKQSKHTGRIVTSSVVAVLSVIVTVLLYFPWEEL